MNPNETHLEPHLNERPASERVAEAQEYREGKRMGKEVIGSPIIALDGGEELGNVHDVIFNPDQGRLVGVTIEKKGGLFRGGKTLLVRTETMHAIGEDAITVPSSSGLEEIDQSVSKFVEEVGDTILGKRLMTDGGDFLGKIDDVLLDRDAKRIAAFKVSGGLWNDLMRGQTDVAIEEIRSIGPDVVIVPASVKSKVEEVSGGLIGTAQVAGEKLVETKDVVVEKTSQAVETAGEKLSEARDAAAAKIEEEEVAYSVGKVAGNDVAANDGSLIVRQGETITQLHIQKAIEAEKMHALAAAAGKAQAADLYDTAKEKTAAGLETAKEKASAGLETVKEKTAEAQSAFKDKQGELLVGRTAGRDMVDADGSVVVRAGTTVGDLDVANARTRGLLGDLTAAVGVQALGDAKDAAAERYDAAKRDVSERVDDARDGMRDGKQALDREVRDALPPSNPHGSTTIVHTDQAVVEIPSSERPRVEVVRPTHELPKP